METIYELKPAAAHIRDRYAGCEFTFDEICVAAQSADSGGSDNCTCREPDADAPADALKLWTGGNTDDFYETDSNRDELISWLEDNAFGDYIVKKMDFSALAREALAAAQAKATTANGWEADPETAQYEEHAREAAEAYEKAADLFDRAGDAQQGAAARTLHAHYEDLVDVIDEAADALAAQ